MHILEVSRTTVASSEVVWELLANVSERTRWDDSLEWARLDGSFQKGAAGEVKLKKQPVRKFRILDAVLHEQYTDRFFLPMGGKMDWQHAITQLDNGKNVITFSINASGPTVFLLGPIMKHILKDELPGTVDKLVQVAEALTPRQAAR